MSSTKIVYSLPKTQPTLSSSSNSRIKSHIKSPVFGLSRQPSVSAFITDEKQQKYTHNMKIDYGKLSKPFHEKLQTSIKKEIDLSADLGILLSTRKFKNLKQYTLNDTQREQKEGIEPPIHSLLTQKKAFSTQRIIQFSNPESANKIQESKQKKKNRIMSVKAYEKLNISRLSEKNQLKQSKRTMRSDQKQNSIANVFDKITISKLKGEKQIEQPVRTDRSDRKISHSRIIKTFNPTAGIQTKIITYPDLTEVFKIRQSRKKMI